MYRIILHRRATRFYDRLEKKQQRRLNRAIDKLRDNPFFGRDIKKLRGRIEDKYRIRVGPFRAVYLVNEEKNLVIVESIGPQGNIY